MRTHTEALADLPPETRTALTTRSDAKGLAHLAGHVGLIAVTGAGIAAQIPFWGLLLLPYGVLLVFLFTLSHECTHDTPFASRWLCRAVGHATAPVLMLPFTWFRYFHFAHHKHTNDTEKDPEIAGHGRPDTWRNYLIYLSGWGYWAGNARTLLKNAFGTIDAPYLPQRQHSALSREARILLALYGCGVLSLFISPLILWLWLVPVLISQPVLRLYLLAEHGHCPPVADMLENSRTTLTNRAVRWLAWNMPYHAEHHAFPAVPFHKLPDLHAHLRADLKSVSPGYVDFSRDYAANLSRPGAS
ncbi:MAG: fatty acid desaturase [Pseudomonadota bacterium]